MSIPFFKISWDQSDVDQVTKVIQRGMYWANGPEITEFENNIAKYVGAKHGLAFSSGTAALHAVLDSLDIVGKEVIVPSFTFIATANSVIMAGGTPVFADIEETTFGLDPKDVEKKITSKTKAIMPVHYGGFPCKVHELQEVAEDHDLILIEDAAESLGAKIESKFVSTFGKAGMISFTPTKVISTGEGGIIVTDNRDLYEKMKLFRSHGRNEAEDYFTSIKPFDYISLGYNFRMPTICAALGISQLNKVENIIRRRREIAKKYQEFLLDLKDVSILKEFGHNRNVYQMFPILLMDRKTRDDLQEGLFKKGISAKVYFDPVHLTHYYKNVRRTRTKLKTTENISSRVLCLPIYPNLSDKEIKMIETSIRSFFKDSK